MTGLPDQEKQARLIYEIERAALVWNEFAGAIIDGWYPGRSRRYGDGAKFKDSDRERLEQLFKIRDYETRHLVGVLRELDIEPTNPDYAAIYDRLSAATEITSNSHKPL